MVIELYEYGLLLLIVTIGSLFSLYIGYRVAKPRYIDPIANSLHTIPARIGKQLAETVKDIDVGEIMGQLGGGEGGGNPVEALGMLGGSGKGGLGDLIGLLTQLGAKNKGGGGSSGW